MSVWVHSLSLIVPKQVVETRYPGGCDALVIALSSLARPPRTYSEADDRLVCATFRDHRHLEPARALLIANGFTETIDGDFIDFACVEPEHGPTAPCEWLSWRIDEDGRTVAWHASGEEGALWMPLEANAFEQPARSHVLILSCDGGVEYQLDFRTGAVTSHAVDPTRGDDDVEDESDSLDYLDDVIDDEGNEAGGAPRELHLIIADSLRTRGQLFHRLTPGAFGMRVRHTRATYDVIVMANEESRLVSCYVTHSVLVPEPRRSALAEAITRANWGFGMGSFDLDFDEGTMRFRTAIDVEGGTLVPKMLDNMIGTSLYTMERFHEAFMRVVWGGVEAREAVAQVLGGEEG